MTENIKMPKNMINKVELLPGLKPSCTLLCHLLAYVSYVIALGFTFGISVLRTLIEFEYIHIGLRETYDMYFGKYPNIHLLYASESAFTRSRCYWILLVVYYLFT